jgi:hypothetical protein
MPKLLEMHLQLTICVGVVNKAMEYTTLALHFRCARRDAGVRQLPSWGPGPPMFVPANVPS